MIKIKYIISFLLISNTLLYAIDQTSFEIGETLDLFNERGYSANSNISDNGKVAISTTNGNLIYSYPIQDVTINQVPLNLSLNYSNNLTYKSLGYYWPAEKCWRYLTQNRPGWILGVNGFAVQMLHGAKFYACNPILNTMETLPDTIGDYYLNWIADGYDVCNRIESFYKYAGASDKGYQDEIRILRADGSVLTLRNSITSTMLPSGTTINSYDFYNDTTLITGKYYEMGINAKGYAIVTMVNYIAKEFADYEDLGHFGIQMDTPDFSSRALFKDRLVYYYPGDGMVYLFREHKQCWSEFTDRYRYPYVLNRAIQNNGTTFGWNDPGIENSGNPTLHGPECVPSIFYLVEIRDEMGRVVHLNYTSREFDDPNDLPKPKFQSCKIVEKNHRMKEYTLGRGLFTGFFADNLFSISYQRDEIRLRSYSQRYIIELDEDARIVSGKKKEDLTHGYGNFLPDGTEYCMFTKTNIDNFRILEPVSTDRWPDTYFYFSFNDYIARIIEMDRNEHFTKTTKFYYDTIQKCAHMPFFPAESGFNITDFVFPMQNIISDPLNLDSGMYLQFRVSLLDSVAEPSISHSFKYHRTRQTYNNIPMYPYWEADSRRLTFCLDELYSDCIAWGTDGVGVNRIEGHREFDPDNILQRSTYYTFSLDSSRHHALDNCNMKFVDEVTNDTTITTFKYDETRLFIPEQNGGGFIPSYPPSYYWYHTYLQKKTTYFDDYKVIEEYEVAPVMRDYTDTTNILLPLKNLSYIQKYDGTSFLTSCNTFRYTKIDSVRIYGKYETIHRLLGQDILTQTTEIRDPADTSKILKKTLKEYLHLQPSSLINSYCRSCSNVKNKSKLQALPPDNQFSKEYTFPFYSGLLKSEFVLDSNDNIFRGIVNDYDTSPACSIDSIVHPRGKIVRDSLCYQDTMFLNNSYVYQNYNLRIDKQQALASENSNMDYKPNGPGRINSIIGPFGSVVYSNYDRWIDSTYMLYPFCQSGHNSGPYFGKLSETDYAIVRHIPPDSEPLSILLTRTQPIGIQKLIRKYEADSSHIDTTAITEAFSYGWDGQIIEKSNPNGWESQFFYLDDQRIEKIVLPGDFKASECAAIDFKSLTGNSFVHIEIDSMLYEKQIFINEQGDTNCYCDTIITPTVINNEGDILLRSQSNILILDTNSCLLCEEMCNIATKSDTAAGPNDIIIAEGSEKWHYISQYYGDADFILPISLHIDRLDSLVLEFDINFTSMFEPGMSLIFRVNHKYAHELTEIITIVINNDENFDPEKYKSQRIRLNDDIANEIKARINTPLQSATINFSLESLGEIFIAGDSLSGPKLKIYGQIENSALKIDTSYTHQFRYTNGLRMQFDEPWGLKRTVISKLDDALHSNDDIGDEFIRTTKFTDCYGIDNRKLYTQRISSDLEGTVSYRYTGTGLQTKIIDQEGVYWITEYDDQGRPVKKICPASSDHDSSVVTFEYEYNAPSYYGLDDYEYHGLCYKESVRSSNTITNAVYYDGLGRKKKEVLDEGGLNKTTDFYYDVWDRITHIVNTVDPLDSTKNQIIRYWYDKFGNIKYKYQADQGIFSYKYDILGNLRFSQNQSQIDSNKMSFFQYDDMNRVTIVGETSFNSSNNLLFDPETDMYNDNLALNNWTDQLEPNMLHHLAIGSLYTSNITLWDESLNDSAQYFSPNEINKHILYNPSGLFSMNNMLGTDLDYDSLYTVHPVFQHDILTATADDPMTFEDISQYPDNVLIAYYYDEMPYVHGPVWGHMPDSADWHRICPNKLSVFYYNIYEFGEGFKCRNQIGKLSAIAYREHGGQPFNYMVFSYDERGRLESLLRYTENIGFDAIYYEYNSANMVTTVHVVGPSHHQTTYYGYNDKGQLAKVWSIEPKEPGLYGSADNWHPDSPVYVGYDVALLPTEPDICYYYDMNVDKREKVTCITYNKLEHIDSLRVKFIYDAPGRIMSMNCLDPDGLSKFSQQFTYYNSDMNQIKDIQNIFRPRDLSYIHNVFRYHYDALNRLSGTSKPDSSEYPDNLLENVYNYQYDLMGNRVMASDSSIVAGLLEKDNYMIDDQYLFPNRINKTVHDNPGNGYLKDYEYEYDGSGRLIHKNGFVAHEDFSAYEDSRMRYSARGLLMSYSAFPKNLIESEDCIPYLESYRKEWRYSYNPLNEREQKRVYKAPGGDEMMNVYPWVYYQLGVDNRQYALYYGFQSADETLRTDSGNVASLFSADHAVYMFPGEFNSFASGSAPAISWRYDRDHGWLRHIGIYDYLGSKRLNLREDQYTDDISMYEYKPYGSLLAQYGNAGSRLQYIGKEVDSESGDANHGVRQYSQLDGRFYCPDKMWEFYYSLSPYQYSMNNPVQYYDENGFTVYGGTADDRSAIKFSVGSNYSKYVHFNDMGGVLFKGDDGKELTESQIDDIIAENPEASENFAKLVKLNICGSDIHINGIGDQDLFEYCDSWNSRASYDEFGNRTGKREKWPSVQKRSFKQLGLDLSYDGRKAVCGIFLSADAVYSPNSKGWLMWSPEGVNQIYYSTDFKDLTAAQIVAHELYSHAFFYLILRQLHGHQDPGVTPASERAEKKAK